MTPEEKSAWAKLTKEQIGAVYTAIWQNISREDSNSHNRTSWALSLTSGQFIAISFLMNHVADSWRWALIALGGSALLSLLGVIFCHRTRHGLAAAHDQIGYLTDNYDDKGRKSEFDALCLPRPFGDAVSQKGESKWRYLDNFLDVVLFMGDAKDPGRRTCASYVRILLVVWIIIFVVSLIGIGWVLLGTQASDFGQQTRVILTASK